MENTNQGYLNSEFLTIARGAGIVLFGSSIGNFLKYLLHIMMARYLGPEVFGFLILGLAVLTVSGVIAELGLPNGVMRYVAIFRGSNERRRLKGTIFLGVKTGILFGSLSGVILFWFSPVIAVRIFNSPELTPVLRVFCFILPFSTSTSMFVYAIQGFKAIAYKVLIKDFFDSMMKIILVSLVLLLDGKLKGILFSYLGVAVLSLILAYFCLRHLFPDVSDKKVKPIQEAGKLFSFSWPLLFVHFIGQLLLVTDTFMLGILRSPEEVGIYGAAQKTALLSGMILTSFLAIFAPVMADYHNRDKRKEMLTLYQVVSKWSFSVTLPFSLMLIIFSRNVIQFFGAGFQSGDLSLIILASGWLVHSLMGCAGTLLTMSGRSRLHLVNFILLFLCNITLNFLLIPRFGILGAALATAITIVLIDILTVVEVKVILRMFPFRTDILKPLSAGILAVLPFLLLTSRLAITNNKAAILAVIIIFLSFFVLILKLAGIGQEEKFVLNHLLRKIRGKGL